MDARYWKEFENMGDMEKDKRSGSDEPSSRYSKDSKKSESSRRKRSRSVSRSRSSSSSSSGSSSRSSSSSSRRHSDERSYRSRKADSYHRKSPSRIRSNSYGSTGCENLENWFSRGHNYSSQTQDINTSSSYLPPSYTQGPPPVQGQYPPNFGGNFHSYPGGGYESSGNYYPPNFPHGSRPPPTHEYPLSGGPSNHSRPPGNHPSNWEMFQGPLPPPILQTPSDGIPNPAMPPDLKSEEAKKEAIQQELIQQKKTFSIQREDYIRRKFSLNRELNRLKDQKRDLVKEKSKDNERILRENAKLQGEIQQKLKSMDSVIEMLTNIIGDSARLPDIIKEIKIKEKEKSEKPKKSEKKKHSPPQAADERCRASSADKDGSTQDSQDENRVFYDPGLHWCSECNVFPKTVSEYLDHLHTSEHKKKSNLKFENYPWHAGKNLRETSPQYNKDAPSRRIPIRAILNVSVSKNRPFTVTAKELLF